MGIVMIVRREAMLQLMSAFIDQRPLIFVLAMLRVLIGLAVVLAHNEWRGTVAIVVSLIGWITLLRGIALHAAASRHGTKGARLSLNGAANITWRRSSRSRLAYG